jgi:hypothetical protein
VAVLDPPPDPSTEPIDGLPPLPPSKPAPATAPPLPSAFDRVRFQFMTGIPAGETAYIRAEDGTAVLSYRSFASVVGIIAALMSAIVFLSGLGGVLFLLLERRPIPAIAALLLSAAFAAAIVMLIPATHATIFDAGAPAMTITQQSSVTFPSATWVVAMPDGKPIAHFRKSFLSRFGRNRWLLLGAGGSSPRGEAVEESFSRALVRKAFGKFAPAYQSNVRIRWAGHEAGWVIRRPGPDGNADVLDIHPASTLDRRAAVALAVLVLGSEP